MNTTATTEDLTSPQSALEDHGEFANSYFEGDVGTLDADIREAITVIMASRVFLARKDPSLWDVIIKNRRPITTHFHNMYIGLVIDRTNKLVYKQQIRPDGVGHRILLKNQSATREMSIAVIYLRNLYNSHTAAGSERVTVTRSELVEEIEAFERPDEHNRDARTKNANGAITALHQQQLLLGRQDGDDWEVSPAVQTLFSAETIARITDWLTTPEGPQFQPPAPRTSDGPAGRDDPALNQERQ